MAQGSTLPVQKDILTPEELVDLEVADNLHVSPSGKQVVYDLTPASKKGDKEVSSLWIADTGKTHSARQLTSGLYNDEVPQFSPDEDCVLFLSDRAKPGESSAVYCLPLTGGEPFPLTNVENKKAIASLKWSPSGRYVAFLSPDEKTKEQEAEDKDKDDPVVFGERWEFNRLRLLHVPTREVTVLVADESHITDFAWSDDEKRIVFVKQQTTELDSPAANGLDFEIVEIASKKSQHVSKFPGSAQELVWHSSNQLYFIGLVTPMIGAVSARCIYEMSMKDGKWNRHSLGDTECAFGLKDSDDEPIVQVQSGLTDQLRLLSASGKPIWSQQSQILTWNLSQNKSVYAMGLSTVDGPAEVYSIESSDSLVRLSNHSSKLASKIPTHNAESFYCEARDGTNLDGLFLTPVGAKNNVPMPTLVSIHGGPYSRSTKSFDNSYFGFTPYLLSGGEVGVLCPNYRGSSSRGEEFAAKIRGRMGTEDYTDVIDMIQAAIKQGLVDKDRVMVGGWSQGGFLSYLSMSRNNEAEQGFKLRGVICGAGVVDWDMMAMSSDLPIFECELAGKAPWSSDEDSLNGRHGSAIWHMKKLATAEREQTPVLILHGERDERVPHSQAVAFHRACRQYGIPYEFVTYPREGHAIKERAHRVDMLKRVRKFVEQNLL
ncbi:MAG: hypothetical protein Q9160_009238 [Pyrenula sp. 1 TL-2023]